MIVKSFCIVADSKVWVCVGICESCVGICGKYVVFVGVCGKMCYLWKCVEVLWYFFCVEICGTYVIFVEICGY